MKIFAAEPTLKPLVAVELTVTDRERICGGGGSGSGGRSAPAPVRARVWAQEEEEEDQEEEEEEEHDTRTHGEKRHRAMTGQRPEGPRQRAVDEERRKPSPEQSTAQPIPFYSIPFHSIRPLILM